MPEEFEAKFFAARNALRMERRANSEWQVIFRMIPIQFCAKRPRGIASKNEIAHEKNNRAVGTRIWSAWRRIGYFAKDGGVVRAGGAGKIVGALAECFVGENGKCESLFGVSGNAESVGGNNFERRKERGEIGDEQGIARAAAGEDEF